MANQVQTDLLLKAKTQGFPESRGEVAKIRQEARQLESGLQTLTRRQLELTKALQAVARGSAAYKDMARQLRDVSKEAGAVENVLRRVDRLTRESSHRQGAFTQGLLQGVLPQAAFLQRGPGMFRQAVGVAAGQSLRGTVGGLLSTPFTGAAGLGGAIGALPGGSALSSLFGSGISFAGAALQQRQQIQDLMPLLGGFGLGRRTAAARAAAEASTPVVDPAVRAALETNEMAEMVGRGTPWSRAQRDEVLRRAGGGFGFDPASAQGFVEVPEATPLAQRQAAAAARAEAAERRRFLGGLRGAGHSVGLTQGETLGHVGGLLQAGGGDLESLRRNGLLGTSLDAMRGLGVSTGVSGAFLGGGRRGGIVGGFGAGGDALVGALEGAVRLGLQGSELTQYMEQMAGDMASFAQTGIPINPGSIAGVAGAFGRLGLGGLRGATVAQQLQTRGRELGQRGPQSSEELMMLQALGGFGGGGAEDLNKAMIALERGDFRQGGLMKMLGGLQGAGGGGIGGSFVLQRALRSLGVNLSREESATLGTQVEGGKLTPEMQRLLQERLTGAPMGAELGGRGGLRRLAAAATDPAVQRAAAITDRQIDAGDRLIPTMNNLNESVTNLTKSFSTLAGSGLKELTDAIRKVTEVAPGVGTRAGRLGGVSTGAQP